MDPAWLDKLRKEPTDLQTLSLRINLHGTRAGHRHRRLIRELHALKAHLDGMRMSMIPLKDPDLECMAEHLSELTEIIAEDSDDLAMIMTSLEAFLAHEQSG